MQTQRPHLRVLVPVFITFVFWRALPACDHQESARQAPEESAQNQGEGEAVGSAPLETPKASPTPSPSPVPNPIPEESLVSNPIPEESLVSNPIPEESSVPEESSIPDQSSKRKPPPKPPQTPPPSPADPASCDLVVDQCPVAGGVTWQCKKRFIHGVNYAWHHFGGDFGGIASWGLKGVAATPAVDTELADIKSFGSNVIRWWVMPDFRGDGVLFDSNDSPTGLGVTFVEDLLKALALAEKHDLYLMLNIFSFDNFRPTNTNSGLKTRGLYPIVTDPAKRKALLDNVIRPMARAAAASPFKNRLMSWDLINEPEWAMSGPSKYSDPAFDCNPSLQCLTHDQMEGFLREVTTVLRAESKALVTLGSAAIKWKNSWTKLDLDYYQFHTYDWVDQYYPYSKSPAQYGVTDKPVVMGEYPLTGLAGVPVPTMLSSYLTTGYGGALGWSVTDPSFSWGSQKTILKDFADKHPCETRF